MSVAKSLIEIAVIVLAVLAVVGGFILLAAGARLGYVLPNALWIAQRSSTAFCAAKLLSSGVMEAARAYPPMLGRVCFCSSVTFVRASRLSLSETPRNRYGIALCVRAFGGRGQTTTRLSFRHPKQVPPRSSPEIPIGSATVFAPLVDIIWCERDGVRALNLRPNTSDHDVCRRETMRECWCTCVSACESGRLCHQRIVERLA